MRADPTNSTRCKHLWVHHNRGVVWHRAVLRWAEGGGERNGGKKDEDRITKRKEGCFQQEKAMLENVKLPVVHLKKQTGKELVKPPPEDWEVKERRSKSTF